MAALDPAVPLSDVRTLADVARASEGRRFFMLALLATFAGLALVLAAVGLYGVVSYTCSMRTREIGLRMAVGAGRARVLRMVAGDSAIMVAAGLALGLAGAAALSRLLESLLYDVSTTDVGTYASVALFLTLVSALATWVPARRATAVDPASILRS